MAGQWHTVTVVQEGDIYNDLEADGELYSEMLKTLRDVTKALNGRVHSRPALNALVRAEAIIRRVGQE